MENGIRYGVKEMALSLALLRDKDDKREELRHVWCDGERLMASDGKKLAFTDSAYGLEKGMYDIRRKGRKCEYVKVPEDGLAFPPSWKTVVPDYSESNSRIWDTRGGEWFMEAYRDMLDLRMYVSPDFLHELGKTGAKWSVRCEYPFPWTLEADGVTMVVQGMTTGGSREGCVLDDAMAARGFVFNGKDGGRRWGKIFPDRMLFISVSSERRGGKWETSVDWRREGDPISITARGWHVTSSIERGISCLKEKNNPSVALDELIFLMDEIERRIA